MCYVLCLERLAFYFQFALFSLVLFAGDNNLDPSMPCLGEKHAPLLPQMLIVLTSIFVECSFLFLVAIMFSSCSSCLSLRAKI